MLADTGKGEEKNEQKQMKKGTPDKAGLCGVHPGEEHPRMIVTGRHIQRGREKQRSHQHRLILDHRDTWHQQ